MVLRNGLFIFTIALLASCDGVEQGAGNDGTSVEVPNGAILFMNHCSTCHGVDGKLSQAGAKDLTKTALPLLQIKKTIETGTIGGMPRFKEVLGSEAAVDAVAQYVLTLKR